MIYYTLLMLVHMTQLVLSSTTLSNEIFCGSFLVKNHVFCACKSSEMNFIPQPEEQKSGRRQTQYYSTLCECWCTWSGRCGSPKQQNKFSIMILCATYSTCCCCCCCCVCCCLWFCVCVYIQLVSVHHNSKTNSVSWCCVPLHSTCRCSWWKQLFNLLLLLLLLLCVMLCAHIQFV